MYEEKASDAAEKQGKCMFVIHTESSACKVSEERGSTLESCHLRHCEEKAEQRPLEKSRVAFLAEPLQVGQVDEGLKVATTGVSGCPS